MTDKTLISVSTMDGVATIMMHRAEKRNALNGHLVRELHLAFQKIANDKNIAVTIIRGQGEHFCAGADIAWMQKMAKSNPQENRQDAQALADLLYCIHTFPKPVIVLTQGATLGGGLGIIAAADIAIAAANASYCFSEVKMGLAPYVVSPYVIAAIGERAARYHFLTATPFDSHEAHRIGLIHHVVDIGALASTGLNIAHELIKHSPDALNSAKKLTQLVSHEKITKELGEMTAELLAKMRLSSHAREGLQAFIDKRTPKWIE